MRHAARSLEIAELAVDFRDKGVVGFDIAGAEAGYPPSRHLAAFQHMQRENGHFTIHAGDSSLGHGADTTPRRDTMRTVCALTRRRG